MNSNVEWARNGLKYTFGVVPIVAGLDKFTHILTDWSKYLNEAIVNMLPFEAGTFMMIVGVIEIFAGVLVLWRTRMGAIVVAAWLALIAVTLLLDWIYVDVAVRDLVMAIAALSLAKLEKGVLPAP